MQRTYTGPHNEVQVHLPSGPVLIVKHGESIDVNARDAEALDQQPDSWAGGDRYTSRKVAELEALVLERGLTPEGSGADGRVVKDDLIAALEAADAAPPAPPAGAGEGKGADTTGGDAGDGVEGAVENEPAGTPEKE